ncbi:MULTISPECIES: DUF1310 family protein [Enterococcus]|uniref:DUF1310 family protein n=2 Tax=Enterococcus TaxID=1350 RepID=A0AAI8LJG4_ENTFC|nr:MULTISPECIES: DUF1310 family protein [Enterococcus]AII40263.1 hypothetical protein M395_02780 [Enterococcus faecium T110]AYM72266.1 DUF1310 family protein [Enterococcus faecium]MBL5006298.1 hypothetical protein [Enterococcus lactis]MBL5012304.1 hypothetical protein [Enterococcus lactis]MBQ0861960.1 DUF1310 domain-containing protein [Enterococcus lactis]
MKKKKWWLVSLIGILILLGIGGKLVIDKEKLQKEMIEVVKSEEAKQVVEEGLKNLDPKALTPEGVIQSYEIDYDSIEHNPMGGINVTILANRKENLYVFFTLKKNESGELKDGGGGNSSDLEKLLEGDKYVK